MSRSRKTRTKSIDGLPPRHIRKLRHVRRQVAAEAARIIATEGQHNYRAAKKKAADRIGVSERLALPSNVEVQEALSSYQNLYGGQQHWSNLERLRDAASRAMRLLEPFEPRLVGPVLDGTAGEHSRISLHVFCDSPDELVMHFLDEGLPFRQGQRQIRWYDSSHRQLPLVVVEFEDVTVELAIFSWVHLRQAPPSPIDGKPQKRATLADVETLLNQPRLSNGTY